MSLEDAFASKVKIAQVLRRAKEPLISHQIAKRCKLSPQLVGYQLERLIEWGIVTTVVEEEKTLYQLQEPYYEDQALERLSEALIPFMEKISAKMEFSQVKSDEAEAVVKNLFMFMRLFETEIEKTFNKTKAIPKTISNDFK